MAGERALGFRLGLGIGMQLKLGLEGPWALDFDRRGRARGPWALDEWG